jgi:hypothetical protein
MATLQGEALCPGCRDLARKKITEEQMQVLRDLFPDEVIVRRCGRIFALTEDGARGYDHRLLIAMERMGLVEKEHAKFSDAYQLAWGGLRKLEQCLSLPPRELGGEMELLRPVISHAAHALNAMLRERVGFWSVGVGAGRLYVYASPRGCDLKEIACGWWQGWPVKISRCGRPVPA